MTDESLGIPRYFLTYTGVKLPLKLLNELAADQLENRITYFQGYHDDQGRLIGVKKMVYGEVEMQHRYFYDDSDVLRRAEITDIDGEVTELAFAAI
jgi:YD repeat-containing protein